MTTRICQQCGNDFTPLKYADRVKYCSGDCLARWRYIHYQKPAKQRRVFRALEQVAEELEKVA